MTYWIVIAMIFVAILAVAVATANASRTDHTSVGNDDKPADEGMTDDEHL